MYYFFIPVFLFFVYMLYLITSLLELTLSTFPTRSLVEDGLICRVSMRFHLMIPSQNFTNSAPCNALVKKYSIMGFLLDRNLHLSHTVYKKRCPCPFRGCQGSFEPVMVYTIILSSNNGGWHQYPRGTPDPPPQVRALRQPSPLGDS